MDATPMSVQEIMKNFRLLIFDCRLKTQLGNRHSAIVNRQLGMTLMELMVASTISMVVILAIGQVDVTRIYLTDYIRGARSGQAFSGEAAAALSHMLKQLEQADRVVVRTADCTAVANPGMCIQLRIPINPNNLDVAAGYRWDQYRLVDTNADAAPDAIRFGCGAAAQFFRDASALTIRYADEAPPPPGGDPPVQDNNVVEVVVSSTNMWDTADPADDVTLTYRGEMTIRAGAYTNTPNGLAPAGVSDPPGPC